MEGLAIVLGLIAAACLYLASPNQVLVARRASLPSAGVLCWSALALTVLGTWLWALSHGWPSAIAGMLVTLTCAVSAWPFFGTWVQSRRANAQEAA
ncbi:hypothetical protein [Cupriavidus sp. AU9028]|uniref:hypothetical protein n=1 Tax=Cupriavidus sp. AU9028 TaxID=2871157 RepID=UPI001C95A490|nr:hypothetical protein [Cupriavidus sp. AU9028]MBY4897593.1 hypothetical protein [Cupriavidus sp. AU9028]